MSSIDAGTPVNLPGGKGHGMAQPQKKTIADEVWERVREAVKTAARYWSPDDFAFKSFQRDADKLGNADGFSASLVRAHAWGLVGDIQKVVYWLNNAQRLCPGAGVVDMHAAIWHSNLGYFSEAATYYNRVSSDATDINRAELPLLGLACGAFRMFDGTPVAEDTHGSVALARRCAMILEKLHVSQEAARAVLDAAGEIMRRHELFYVGNAPVIHTMDDEDGLGMLYELVLPVDSASADRLTDEVIDLLIERDLDRLGVSFSFIPGEPLKAGQE